MTSSSKKILILMETTHSYTLEIIEGISRFAQKHKCWSLFLDDQGVIRSIPEWVRSWRGDGIIVRSASTAVNRLVRKLGVPFVELLGDGKNATSDVLSDEKLIGQMAYEHFHERGFRNFAWFSFGQNWWSRGFRNAFIHPIHLAGEHCFICPTTYRETDTLHAPDITKRQERQILLWLRSLPKPIAVFCPRDVNAIFLLNLCQMNGIAIPDQVAVLGIGNNRILCSSTTPSLSSIAANGNMTGYRAAELLDRMMAKKSLPALPILIPPLHVETRQSTDTIAVDHPDFVAAMRMIRNSTFRRISVAEIAGKLCVSRRTLVRWFRKYINRTPEEEIIRVRLERAKFLLRDPSLSIASVARQLQYTLVEHFIRDFRHRFGMTPGEFRKRL